MFLKILLGALRAPGIRGGGSYPEVAKSAGALRKIWGFLRGGGSYPEMEGISIRPNYKNALIATHSFRAGDYDFKRKCSFQMGFHGGIPPSSVFSEFVLHVRFKFQNPNNTLP